MSLPISPKVENLVRERAAAEGVSIEELLTRTFAPKQNDVPQNAALIRAPKAHVQALLAQWQQDNTPLVPPTRRDAGPGAISPVGRGGRAHDRRGERSRRQTLGRG